MRSSYLRMWKPEAPFGISSSGSQNVLRFRMAVKKHRLFENGRFCVAGCPNLFKRLYAVFHLNARDWRSSRVHNNTCQILSMKWTIKCDEIYSCPRRQRKREQSQHQTNLHCNPTHCNNSPDYYLSKIVGYFFSVAACLTTCAPGKYPVRVRTISLPWPLPSAVTSTRRKPGTMLGLVEW